MKKIIFLLAVIFTITTNLFGTIYICSFTLGGGVFLMHLLVSLNY